MSQKYSAFVLLHNSTPVEVVQTEWLVHIKRFSMSRRELFTFMDGYCQGKGEEFSFDELDLKEHRSLPIKEV